MVRVSYHASHEQFAPSRLLKLVKAAEAAGFSAAKSSDHFHPWSVRQGQSGFAWSWLGSALEVTDFPIGSITAPGYRYHPAVVAQAAATLGEMYPGRFWLALGSGEAINESITGMVWPDKAERNARLMECVDVIRGLLDGETVTHYGRVTVVEAKLYSRPVRPLPLFGAAVSEATAKQCGGWADGLLTTGHDVDAVRKVADAFWTNGGAGKPAHVQMAVSLGASVSEAEDHALNQWSSAAIGGEVNWDLRRPKDFDLATRFVGPEEIRESVFIVDSMAAIAERVLELGAIGVDVVHLHQVGTNQEQFIEDFAASTLATARTDNAEKMP